MVVDLYTSGIWTVIADLILASRNNRSFVIVIVVAASFPRPPTHIYMPSSVAGKYSGNALLQLFRPHESRMHCSCCKYSWYRRLSLSPEAYVLFVSLYTSVLMNYS